MCRTDTHAAELRDWYARLRGKLLLAAEGRSVDPAKAEALDRLMLDLLDELDVRGALEPTARAA